MSELDDKRLAEIRERANAATQGPWFWKQSYELDHGLHWELTNPELDKRGRTIDASLILAHDQPTWLHQPCETLPNWEFIAHAREDIDYLLSRVAAPIEDKEEEVYDAGYEAFCQEENEL